MPRLKTRQRRTTRPAFFSFNDSATFENGFTMRLNSLQHPPKFRRLAASIGLQRGTRRTEP